MGPGALGHFHHNGKQARQRAYLQCCSLFSLELEGWIEATTALTLLPGLMPSLFVSMTTGNPKSKLEPGSLHAAMAKPPGPIMIYVGTRPRSKTHDAAPSCMITAYAYHQLMLLCIADHTRVLAIDEPNDSSTKIL